MKQIIGFLSLILVINWTTSSIVKNHTCLSETAGMCILAQVIYNRSQDTTHIFPQYQTHVRIGSELWTNGIHSLVTVLDVDLYQALGEPKRLEIVNVHMEKLQIPRELSFGNFADNRLSGFSIESGNTEPKLTYLDLGQNSISDLTNITGLVNLETLYLYSNDIKTLETTLFQNFTKLKILNLNYNSIHQIVGDQLSQSLISLSLYQNELKSLNNRSLQLASLEILNIERNDLQSIDASDLMLSVPKLKLIRLGGNKINRYTLFAIIGTFRKHNVNYRDEADGLPCRHDEETIEGICMKRSGGHQESTSEL